MEPDVWSAIANCATAVIALGSAFLIVYQLSELKKGQHSQAVSLIYDSFIELDQFFLRNPDFRPYVYDQKDVSDMSPELVKVHEALAEMVTDILYKAFNQKEVLDPYGFKSEVNYMRSMFSSPLMHGYLTQRKEWYRADFSAAMLN